MKKLGKIIVLIVFLLNVITVFCQKDATESYGIHTVKQGETLYSISQKYFLSVNDIKEVNKTIKNNDINVGQELKIPLTVRNSSLFSSKNTVVEQVQVVDEQALFKPKNNKKKNNAKIDKSRNLNIALLLPLFYEHIDELSFNQYNIDENRNKNYKCFNYISFYEGARIALDNLEKQGYKVSLYVFDVGENDADKMNKALSYKNMKDMDLIVPLVFKNSFDIVAKFASLHSIPVINPMSSNDEILNNKYVFKIQPDDLSKSYAITKYLQSKYANSNIIVLFDDKFTPQPVFNYWKETLPNIFSSWTIINYRKNAVKFKTYLQQDKHNVVINLIDKNNEKDNKTQALSIINTLLSSKKEITLFADNNWIEYVGNDYKSLEDLQLHFVLSYYNDYTNANFAEFVKQYRNNFKTDPDKIYAAIGYDIFTYFVMALAEKGKDFVNNPNIKNEKDMIVRYHFKRQNDNSGWQNTGAVIYQMEDYKIKAKWNY